MNFQAMTCVVRNLLLNILPFYYWLQSYECTFDLECVSSPYLLNFPVLSSCSISELEMKWRSEFAQSCLILWDAMDCSLPGSCVHGTFQARVLEWVALSFSRGSSWPRDQTLVSCIAGRHFTVWATRKPLS